LHLETLFVLDGRGRITSTREPGGSSGPLFALVRGLPANVWAVRGDVPDDLAREIERLASAEPVAADPRSAPAHAERYLALLRLGGSMQASREGLRIEAGPAFAFPGSVSCLGDVAVIGDERALERHFRGWIPGEIAAGRKPVTAVLVDGHPVSVCFCARSSDAAAEAGVETADGFRGRGFASRVTSAWAVAIRDEGRIPLYSTSWSNHASLAVARKLGLIAYASSWSVYD
jgi:hypothetical protein